MPASRAGPRWCEQPWRGLLGTRKLPCDGGLDGASGLGEQYLARLEVCELGDLLSGQRAPVEDTCLDNELGVSLGEVTQAFGGLHWVSSDKCNSGGAVEVRVESLDTCLFGRDASERVLHHGVGCVAAERPTKLLELRNGESAVLGQYRCVGGAEEFRDFLDCGCLVRPRHGNPSDSVPLCRAGGSSSHHHRQRKNPMRRHEVIR